MEKKVVLCGLPKGVLGLFLTGRGIFSAMWREVRRFSAVVAQGGVSDDRRRDSGANGHQCQRR